MKKIELVKTYREHDPGLEYLRCWVKGVPNGSFDVDRRGASDEAWAFVKERLFGDPDEAPAAVSGERLGRRLRELRERIDTCRVYEADHWSVVLSSDVALDLADALEAQLAPSPDLPEGVAVAADGRMYAPGDVVRTLPDAEWERRVDGGGAWVTDTNAGASYRSFYEVRRRPTPRTERVAWHEARERRTEGGRLILEVATDGMGPKYRVGGEWTRVPDGMVTVLAEDGPR